MSDNLKLPGNIIALTVILVAMLLLAGFAIGSVVLEGSRRAQETDKAVGAFYMANSGIEMQLYEFRKNRRSLAEVASTVSLYPGGSSWISTTGYETSTQKLINFLPEEELAFVDLFDPDAIDVPAGVASADIVWEGDGLGCEPDLEIGYTEWSVSASIVWPTGGEYLIAIAPFASHLSYSLGPLNTLKAYRLRIRPFKCGARDIRVVLKDSSGTVLPYPGEIVLGSEGTYQKATQRLKVSLPRQDILSGIFSYIVFSQEQLCKRVGGAGFCP